ASDLYYENGYTSNIITREDVVDEENRSISFVINIIERPRSHIERIVIKGNTKTKDEVILRELNIETGDIFSRNKFMTGMRNLYNLQFFSSILPDLTQGSEENLVEMVISVEEGNTTSIEFGLTFTGSANAETFPVSLFAKFQDNNLMGSGQALGTTATLAFDEQSLEVSYAHRYLFNLPLTINFSLGAAHTVNYTEQIMYLPSMNNTDYQMSYDQWDIKLGIGTGYRWLPNFAMVTLSGGFTFGLLQNFYDKTLYVPVDSTVRSNHGKWNWNNTIWTSIALDDRDIYYDPTKGWFFKQRIGWTGLFPFIENEYYLKTDTKLEGYLTLLDIPFSDTWSLKFVLAGYSGLSAIFPLSSDLISNSSQLYIDGMFNGRGWNFSSGSLSYIRGNAMWSNWVELRIPVVPNILAIDFFMDAIAVKKDIGDLFTNLGLEDFYFSFGPGFRFSIPQFPLRLMFANTFKVKDGSVVWGSNGRAKGPEWKFTLSFNLANQ
ncbi:MAG: BamA/TamA family outer membrane protein, partial [Spirochaetaceae bacterium]|nr:BamA/TamA family outer membrane protein [Spirochaetaceae bacterium]